LKTSFVAGEKSFWLPKNFQPAEETSRGGYAGTVGSDRTAPFTNNTRLRVKEKPCANPAFSIPWMEDTLAAALKIQGRFPAARN
jgi:hypothetical protein